MGLGGRGSGRAETGARVGGRVSLVILDSLDSLVSLYHISYSKRFLLVFYGSCAGQRAREGQKREKKRRGTEGEAGLEQAQAQAQAQEKRALRPGP